MKRHEVLAAVEKTVRDLIRQLTPDPEERCQKALGQLGRLTRLAKSFSPGEVPEYFTIGIQEIIGQLDAFRTGFARTAEQEGSGGLKEIAKSDQKELSLVDFAKHARDTIKQALVDVEQARLGKALRALHQLNRDIIKAESFESTSPETVTVTNDPMAIEPTQTDGNIATQTSGSSSSNFVTNPEEIAKADGCIKDELSTIVQVVEKASPDHRVTSVGWCDDLNSPAFLNGERPVIDFNDVKRG